MGLITFTSDFGKQDHYIAAVKANIVKVNSSLRIIDISHEIEPFDLAHAAYVVKSVFREFPKGSVHLVSLDTYTKNWGALAMKLDDHFFVGPDNGVLSLISQNKPAAIIDLMSLNPIETVFPSKSIYAVAAANIASSKNLQDLGPAKTEWVQLLDRQLKTTKTLIVGNIIRVDHYGNLITNISKNEFETIESMNNGQGFVISLGREKAREIHKTYNAVEPGECFCLFNESGLLEIGINSGNAAELLGLRFDSPININF